MVPDTTSNSAEATTVLSQKTTTTEPVTATAEATPVLSQKTTTTEPVTTKNYVNTTEMTSENQGLAFHTASFIGGIIGGIRVSLAIVLVVGLTLFCYKSRMSHRPFREVVTSSMQTLVQADSLSELA